MGRDWDWDNQKESNQSYEDYLEKVTKAKELEENLEVEKRVIGTSFKSVQYEGWVAIVVGVDIDWVKYEYRYKMQMVNPESQEFMRHSGENTSLKYPERDHDYRYITKLKKDVLGESYTSNKYPGWTATIVEVLPYGYRMKLSNPTEQKEIEIREVWPKFPESYCKWHLKKR